MGISDVALVLTSRFSWAGGQNKSMDGDFDRVAVEVSGMMTLSMAVIHCVVVLVVASQFFSADGLINVTFDGLVLVEVTDMVTVSVPL